MHRTLAIIERELRRFRRSPMLIVMSMIFPLVQLVVLGYAFGGNVKHLKVAHRRSGPRRAGGARSASWRAPSPAARGRSTPSTTPIQGQALDRPAQRPRQRRADDSAGLLAPRAGEERAARRAHRGQHRQLRLGDAGRRPSGSLLGVVQPAGADGAAHLRRSRRSTSSRSIRTCRTSSTCCRARSSCRSS